MQKLLNLSDWLGPIVLTLGSWEAGVPVEQVSPMAAAAKLGSRPLLVIQGGQDELFDAENARMVVAAASGPKEFWFVPEAHHTGIFEMDPELYVNQLDDFYARALNGRVLSSI